MKKDTKQIETHAGRDIQEMPLTSMPQQTTKDEATILISQAIDKNVPVESLERLLAMRRELRAERAKEDFDRAMASFQADCPIIVKTKHARDNYGKILYSYAPIESIIEQVKKQLKDNGFSYSTTMELLENGVKVCVKVTHVSGHSEINCMAVPLGTKTGIMSNTQQVAAAQTFAKRYAFLNAFAIMTGDEDNDAQSTKPVHRESTSKNEVSEIPENKTAMSLGITTAQKIEILRLCAKMDKKIDDLNPWILQRFKVDSYLKLNYNQAEALIRGLQEKLLQNNKKEPEIAEEDKVDINDIPENL